MVGRPATKAGGEGTHRRDRGADLRRNYWDTVQADACRPGFGYALFDFAVIQRERSGRVIGLQRALKGADDGRPRAAHTGGRRDAQARGPDRRLVRRAAGVPAGTFDLVAVGKGWARRVEECARRRSPWRPSAYPADPAKCPDCGKPIAA